MKYTPGPWMVGGPYPSVTVCCTPDEYDAENWEMIAELWNWKNGEAPEEVKANARLIAAAPQLLAALEANMNWIGRPPVDRYSYDSERERAWEMGEQALAAAKGVSDG
jgi:hypothetical protein